MDTGVREPREIGGASQKIANIKNTSSKHTPLSIRHPKCRPQKWTHWVETRRGKSPGSKKR